MKGKTTLDTRPKNGRSNNRFPPWAWEKSRAIQATLPRCTGIARNTGKPCRMLPLKGTDRCVWHTSLRKKQEMGVPSALRLAERAARLAGAPACLRQLPLWAAIGRKMRVVLLEAWLEEVHEGVHGAWWAAVVRVLEWRAHERARLPRLQWSRWLLRPLDGAGGATPIPPTDLGWPPPFLQPHWPERWEIP
jgi:hypothetical protein